MGFDEVDSPSQHKRSIYFDSKSVKHTTIKKRKGSNKGGKSKIARLKDGR